MTADSDTSLEETQVRRWATAWVVAGLFLLLIVWLASSGNAGRNPNVLRIGLPPDQSEDPSSIRYKLLLEHLEAHAGMTVTAYTARSYRQLIDDFSNGKADLVRFGGASFVIAHEAAEAVPLVMREVDRRFTSRFVARADSPGSELADFSMQVMAFGDPLSTSGHLMPRHHLKKQNIDPEQFFSHVLYSGAHDATVLAVTSGKADLGAVNGVILNQMLADNRLPADAVRVVWESPPYPNYVWAVSESLDEDLRDRLRDAFLMLSLDDPGQAAILEAAGTSAYLPAMDVEMDTVHQALKEQGLL